MSRQKKIPKGKLKRSSIVAATTAKAGIKKIGYLSKKPFLSQEAQAEAETINDEEIAKTIFDALCFLRGTALKVAQMISMEIELIPEVYRKELEKASSQVSPISRALIRTIITKELGHPPEKIFRSFDSLPFAAASLGQVHRAISHEGQELAVKIQYPGIDSSVLADIEMLKTLLKPSRYYRIFSSCFNEVQEIIFEELDYIKEADNTKWFKNHLKMDHVVIPVVYPEFSTTHILTTEMIHGAHLDQWLNSSPSREMKNHYGQLLVDIFNHTTLQKTIIHADPNLGNYIFMEKGRLGLIDFGCVKRLSPNLIRALEIARSKDFEQDPDRLNEFYRCAGIYFEPDFNNGEFRSFIHRWIEWILRPEREEWFEFSEENPYFEEGIPLVKEFYQHIDHFEGGFMFFGRAQHGMLRLLQRLGARVRMRPLG